MGLQLQKRQESRVPDQSEQIGLEAAGRGADFNKLGFILGSDDHSSVQYSEGFVHIRAIFGQQIALEGDASVARPYSCQVAVMGPTFALDDGGTGNPYFLSESLSSRSARRKSRLDR